jgi:MYXO-CTERM domain-containing protein
MTRHRVVHDAALAATVLAACQVAVGSRPSPVWWATVAAGLAAVTVRRRWPLPALALAVVAAGVRLATVAPVSLIDVTVLVCVYTVAARYDRGRSLTALTVLLLALGGWTAFHSLRGRPVPGVPRLAFHVIERGDAEPRDEGREAARTVRGKPPAPADVPGAGLFVVGSALVVAWAFGSTARGRREHLAHLRERAEHLERDRDQRAALAVAAERARISREMHDVVAHGLAMIVIQAQGGAASLDAEPAQTRAALEAIVSVGRAALDDVRLVVGALGGAGEESAEVWRPPPGLAQLPALIESVERAGTPVRQRIDGTPAPLPSAVDLSAYRIVQEALTNTMRHASRGAQAEVVLIYDPGLLQVEVRDDGKASAGTPGGNGLRGMRERVRLLGGRVSTGRTPTGGFQVRAVLPLGGCS